MVATIATEEGLKIPVFDAAYTDAKGRNIGKFFNNPEILRHSILQAMFQPEELNSLMIVKLDKSNPDPRQLRASIHDPEDGIKRRMIFQSGNSYYFGDETLAKKIGDLFVTEKDTACRYGSLLVSTCMSGVSECDHLRIKIVDFTDPQYAKYRTGDCHGVISSDLLKSIGGEKNRASQFRFAWLRSWNSENIESTPQVSFLAKGTLRPDDNLLDSQGDKPQLILDRSSIKGINKKQLKELIPCGDYELPKAILGNRKNSQIGITQTSWQSTGIWFDEEAQKQDLVPAAKAEAQRLAALQRDPMKLRQAMIEDYDKREEFLARLNERKLKEQQDKLSTTIDDEINGDTEESAEDKKRERQDIQMLKADKFGLMIGSPEFTNMAERWLASKWRNLATRGALSMTSAMALPCEDLPRGTVCAHHLKEGECVQGRFPILNKDGLRRYQNIHAKNLDIPEEIRTVMTKIKGVIWFHPKDLEKFHQGDFDGDEPFAAGIEYEKEGKELHVLYQYKDALVKREIEYRHSKENDLSWSENELQWAKDLVQRFQEDKSIIYDRTGSDIKARKEEMGKLYDSYRAEIDEIWDTPDRKTRAAHALFQATHTSDNLSKHRTICQKVAEELEITFSLQEDYELLHEALPRDVYVLQVPFQKVKTKDGRTIDLPNQWKDALDSKGIAYEATAHPELPLVEFAFKNLPQSMIAKLDAKYGDNSNDHIDTDSLKVTNYSGNETRLLIVPPVDCRWIESQDKAGRGALVYKLFMDEICDALLNYRVNQIEVVNVKHPDNDYSDEDFSNTKWKEQKVTLQVGTIDLPPTHEKYYRFQGTPIIQLDGKNLGTFSPDSPKLPPGTTFEATLSSDKGGRSVMLKIDRESIRLPETQLPQIDSPSAIAQSDTTPQISETTVNNQKRDITNAKANNWRLSLQDTLFSVVSETYKQRGLQLPSHSTQHFKFGDNQWTAYVQPNGDCFVRNSSKRTVFKANVHTGEVQIPLTEQAAARFQEMIVEREKALSQSRTTLAPTVESKPRVLEMV
jgi:hypothetical protein